jgi:hypothetical protein
MCRSESSSHARSCVVGDASTSTRQAPVLPRCASMNSSKFLCERGALHGEHLRGDRPDADVQGSRFIHRIQAIAAPIMRQALDASRDRRDRDPFS